MWFKCIVIAMLSGVLIAPTVNAGGTVDRFTQLVNEVPLTDEKLSEFRGGFNGMAFNVAFSGYVDKLGNGSGSLAVGQNGAIAPGPPPDVSMKNGEVAISTHIGNFQGANGIFQIAQVPGNYNVVNNNLYVQIAMIELTDLSSQLPSFASMFGTPTK